MSGDLAVELYTGPATGWVAGSVYNRGNVAIARGTSDESTSATPSTADFTLNNRVGNNWDPRNPTGLYYGQIGKNTPCRITLTTLTDTFGRTVAAGWGSTAAPNPQAWTAIGVGGVISGTDTFVSGGFGQHSVPAANAYRANIITGETYLDVDVQVDCLVLPGTAVTGAAVEAGDIILRYTSSSAYYFAQVTIDTAQQVHIGINYVDGTVLAAAVSVAGLTHAGGNTLRVRAQAEGQSIRAKVWDASKPEPYDWLVTGNYIQLGKPTANVAGGVGVRSGLAAGNSNTLPVVAQYDNLIVRVPRFAGEVGAWIQGADQTNQDRYVAVSAAGPLRRLGQPSASVLKSTLRRSIPTLGSSLVAYWPCEDGANATSVASGLTGGVPMAIVGAPQMASYTGFACSAAVPTMAAAGTTSALVGTVPQYVATGSWQVRCLVNVANATDGSTLMRVTTAGSATSWDVSFAAPNDLNVKVYTANGVKIYDQTIAFGVNNTALRLSLQASVSGANIAYTLSTLGIGLGNSAGFFNDTITGQTAPSVNAVSINPFGQCGGYSFGHVTVESQITNIFDLLAQLNAYSSETAIDRMIRLCGENSVPFDFLSNFLAPALMGPQTVNTLVALLNECAAVDMGQLCETRGRVGLLYIGLGVHYNQPAALTLDITQLASPPQPVDDDQQTHNDVTVTRTGGSSANAVLTTGRMSTLPAGQGGIGDYPIGLTLNAFADSQLPDLASWPLHLGTVDAARYPALPVRLVHPPSAAKRARYLAALAVTMPNKIVATGITPDSLSLLTRGYTETYSFSSPGLLMDFVFNCVPGSPYDILALDDTVMGRLDSDTTTLHDATISSSVTSFQVDIGDGTLWTTNAGDWPVLIKMGGEVMSVGAISGSTSPQTFSSVTRSVNGVVKGHTTGEPIHVAQQVYLGLGRN